MKMSVIGSGLLCILAVSHLLGSISADRFTNGFPNVLVAKVFHDQSKIHTLRLIPEMTFTCNDTIVGFTVAGRQQTKQSMNPIVQIWRQNSSQNIYYNTSEVTINEAECLDNFTVLQGSMEDNDQVWYCNLSATNRVPVQAGDILGLLLPPMKQSSFQLSFASVSRGPTNYVFENPQEVPSSYPAVNLSNATFKDYWLPQISVQVESDVKSDCSKCVSGFPDMPVVEVGSCTDSDNVITILIPGMNFARHATIAGFIVAGKMPANSKIQIWRQNTSQFDVYDRVADITVSKDMCVSPGQVANSVLSCILYDKFQVSVQPGDFIGLKLPQSTDNQIYFTANGEPKNYVFKHEFTSSINFNDSESTCTIAQKQPQIAFNLTSGQCTRGFLSKLKGSGEGQRSSSSVNTYLFPNLTFGCSGTIVKLTVTVAMVVNTGQQYPKIQIWRENETHSGLYYKTGTDIAISNSLCENPFNKQSGTFQCTLNEATRVSVQPGDFLGLEIPPTSDNKYELLFSMINSDSKAYIFQHQLPLTVNLSEAAYNITNNLPQIIPLVILDKNEDSCGGHNAKYSESPLICTPPSTQADDAPNVPQDNDVNFDHNVIVIAAPVTSVVTGTLLAVIVLLVVINIVQRRRWKKQTNINNNDDTTYSNLAHNNNPADFRSVSYTAVPEKTPDGKVPEYDEIDQEEEPPKANDSLVPAQAQSGSNHYCNTPQPPGNNHDSSILQNKLHLDNQNYVCGTYEMDEESTQHLSETKEDSDSYWEPAATVNELYRQMSSKKYREISQQQVEMKDVLGSGQFGIVSKGIWQSPMGAMDVAVKQLQPGASEEEKVKFLQEAAINGQFRHPNVVQLMGVVTVGEPTMIVLELMSNGDLRNFLVKQQPQAEKQESVTDHEAGVDKHVLLRFCQHIASGMSYLASKAFVHRDLAARNVLVSGDKICKISDFGMSRNLMDENYYVSHGGKVPVKWTAPEAIHYKKYSTASDVWSFGCVMYEIWSLGHKPFENHTNPEAVKLVDKGYRLPPPPGLSKELYKIMIQCWQPEKNQRPTFPQLVEMLSRADFELLVWEEEDLRNSDPQVKLIGAPLEVAKDLYRELQRSYGVINS